MAITRFIGDAEYQLDLKPRQITRLEKLTNLSIGTLSARIADGRFSHADLTSTIRLALIGGGTSEQDANKLIDVWIDGARLSAVAALASEIIAHLWTGADEQPEDQADVAA